MGRDRGSGIKKKQCRVERKEIIFKRRKKIRKDELIE